MSFEIFVILDIQFVICEKNRNVLLKSTTLVRKKYTSSKIESIMHFEIFYILEFSQFGILVRICTQSTKCSIISPKPKYKYAIHKNMAKLYKEDEQVLNDCSSTSKFSLLNHIHISILVSL